MLGSGMTLIEKPITSESSSGYWGTYLTIVEKQPYRRRLVCRVVRVALLRLRRATAGATIWLLLNNWFH